MKAINIDCKNKTATISKKNVNKNVNTFKDTDISFNFTKLYIKLNKNLIKDLFKNIDSIIVEDFDSFLSINELINYNKVKFTLDTSLTEEVIEQLLKNKELKKIECYFIPEKYIHIFANKNISIIFNKISEFTNSFVKNNKLNNLQNIYYKKVISFYNEIDIYKNIDSFLKINKSLNIINLYYFSMDSLNYLVNKLCEYDFYDVDIFIYQNDENISDLKLFSKELKNLNKRYSHGNDKLIRIIYSDNFFRNNIFKELSLNVLKVSMVLILYMGGVFMVSDRYHEYIAALNLRILENTLASNENEIQIDEIVDTEENDNNVEENNEPDDTIIEEPQEDDSYNMPYNFNTLLDINKDVVGWIRINNTDVNYPVTQGYDNDYYLVHDIYNNWSGTGWVFMDYRNNRYDLDKNTIIYGHNLRSGLMFGTLKKTIYYDWYSNPENHYITFNTINKEMKWHIFSMYQTDYTNDYLTTEFYDEEDFMNFISMICSRSFYDFGVKIKPTDKILTISTCTGSNNRRLAIHAVLEE